MSESGECYCVNDTERDVEHADGGGEEQCDELSSHVLSKWEAEKWRAERLNEREINRNIQQHLSESISGAIHSKSRRVPDREKRWRKVGSNWCYMQRRSLALLMSADMMEAMHEYCMSLDCRNWGAM